MLIARREYKYNLCIHSVSLCAGETFYKNLGKFYQLFKLYFYNFENGKK